MFQVTPLEKANKGKKIIEGKSTIKIKDIVYPALLSLAKTQVKYKIVRDNNMEKVVGHPVIIVANHTRFQDTPIVCQTLKDTLNERGYIFAGKQKLGFADNLFFHIYGSIFLDRKNKSDMVMAQKAMEEYLKIGRTIIIFPEATWNMSAELLMLPMKWGVVKSAQRKNAQIIPTILDYDDEKMECHIAFEKPIIIPENADFKEEIDNLRNVMAARRLSYIEKKQSTRSQINVDDEIEKSNERIAEYPNYDYKYEQSCIYTPYTTPEEVYAPIKKLTPNRQNAFLFNKNHSGIR